MDDISIFPEKDQVPTEALLEEKLGGTYPLWKHIFDYVFEKYPEGKAEWNFPGEKYGWFFRIKDKKRAILYFLPRDSYFKISLIFGDRAVEHIMESPVDEGIKKGLREARKYAEGRGIPIDVKDESVLADIKQLVDIKLSF